ncbi:MAG: hypothetical protein FJY85_02745 [Deltaproteobacteria bacterium]|nr:hypothetical protein [Deltaproteobacteria bacterium]
MTSALIANCLEKIANQVADIRLCVAALEDVEAQGFVETMEYELIAYERQLKSHLKVTRARNGYDTTWSATEDPFSFLSDAFSRIHDHLSSLRLHAVRLGDSYVLEVTKGLELGVLKPMRRLRLHLDIPYDWHERVHAGRTGAT